MFVLLLSACGGGRDDSPPPTPPPVAGCVDNCPSMSTLELKWSANPDLEMVTGYSIFRGPTLETIHTKLIDINVTDAGFSPESPVMFHDLKSDGLGLRVGDTICLQVYSINYVGLSPPSLPSCVDIY